MVKDAIGEMANIVAGGAKANLAQNDLSISLPTVIVGKTHLLEFPSGVAPISIPFASESGPVVIEVGLSEDAAEVAAAG